MNLGQPYYLAKMKEELSLKQRNNPSYSLRAYARDIGIHAGTLSQIINGKRPLPLKDSKAVAKKLKLNPQEQTLFLESLIRAKSALDQIKISPEDSRFMLDESYYKYIAEWEHAVVVELFDLEDFQGTVEEVSVLLDIPLNRAEVVVNNLVVCGIIALEDGKMVRKQSEFRTTEDIHNQALKVFHKETLQMGIENIDKIELELRDFSAVTTSIDREKIPDAKAIIREFRQKMIALAAQGDKTDVYQLSIQFYPLTKQQPEIKH